MLLLNHENTFIDFDGVIKESVEVKADAFEQLFIFSGKIIARKIREHHENNGGMSRFEKIPLYLNWSGQEFSKKLVDEFAKKFSLLVKQKVIDSEWVYGVLEYLANNSKQKRIFLVTATPQQEIEEILSELNIKRFFEEIIGAPTKKYEAIRLILDKYNIDPKQSVMIGDSSNDYESAAANHVSFVLRKTKLNHQLQNQLDCQMIEDFRNG
jgi:phosphoglycolate phosphatase-like HAD superfamily hydrolase